MPNKPFSSETIRFIQTMVCIIFDSTRKKKKTYFSSLDFNGKKHNAKQTKDKNTKTFDLTKSTDKFITLLSNFVTKMN